MANPINMFKHFVKTAWRNLAKRKVFSFINLFGLTAGLTVCLMITLFVINECSVDRFHTHGKNIYRVVRGYDPAKPPSAFTPAPCALALMNDFPGEIKQATRVMPNNADLITYHNRSFNEKNAIWADPNFFTVFSFPLLKGDPATVLRDVNSVVLTEATAKKYFGNEEPIGKVIELNKNLQLTVTGVAKDVPSNSTIDFGIILPLAHITNMPFMQVWTGNNPTFTYVLLDEHVRKERIEGRLPAFLQKYMGPDMQKSGFHFNLTLTPLRDIYFENASAFDAVKHGDKSVVYVFLSVAVLILLIACINFMNLSTIRAIERGKEVGLRKVMGAMRGKLIQQFLGESLLLAAVACVLSLGLLQLLMPLYDSLLGYKLDVPYSAWWLYAILGSAAITVGVLAGGYPALILSRFSPIDALKGKLRLGKGGAFFRQVLVVVQFGISVFLITGTIVIARQMRFMKYKELGYRQTQTLVIPLDNGDIYSNMYAFKQALQRNPEAASVCMVSGVPGGYFDEEAFEAEGQTHPWIARTEFADFEFAQTLGLKIIAGRDLSSQYRTDTLSAVLVNRTAAASLGFTPAAAIGKWIRNTIMDSTRRRIVGVVEDFNYKSLKETIEPLVIAPNPDRGAALVRLMPGNLPRDIERAKAAYAIAAPAYPFDYTFLDQQFDRLYHKDLRQQNILGLFSGLAILIACLGLFGLTSFTTARRTREIGVRKVLGSSSRNIVLLLSKELLQPVLIATLIAVPAAYIVMNHWLQDFAYRTGMSWWIFVLSAFITMAIALCTVIYTAVQAAVANPVESLRME